MKIAKAYIDRCSFQINCWKCGSTRFIYLETGHGAFDINGHLLAGKEVLKTLTMVSVCNCGAKRRVHFDYDQSKERFRGLKAEKLHALRRKVILREQDKRCGNVNGTKKVTQNNKKLKKRKRRAR